MGDEAHEIIPLDPRHPLPARAQRPAQAELERRQKPRQQAALPRQHQPDA